MVGRSISHFQVTEKLGEGGMGVVYKARDNRLDRMVAIKVLSAGAVANAVANHDRQLRFVQEAKSASALNHPNIVTIHEIDTTGDVAFIAMEFIEGETLAQVIPPRGLPFSNAINYAIQIAGALAAAHAVGIVHRDLKPANIMITEKGLVKVLDFGLAKLTGRGMAFGDAETGSTVTLHEPQTEAGLILGTVSYMSPEQAEGKKIDARSDIFSFGAVLYEMLTGHRAFSGETKLSTIAAILNQEPKPLAAVRGVPRDLERIVSRCLRKNPDRRFQVMADVKVALEDLKEESESGKLAAESLEPTRKSARTLVFSAAAVAFLLLAMALSGLWWRRPRNQPTEGALLVRLTTDSGLTSEPAISADGKLVAYASDRAGRGDLDIWVQQANGGSPIRVTFDKADDHQPAFSPDGATVAFRSERQGGGIYVVPALGGEPRLISKQGYDPTFSPDGSQIAYWTGAGVSASTQSQIYVVPASGGISRAAQSELKFARHPIWTPDGKHLLFWGANPNDVDWWVAELGREGASQSPVKLVRTGTTEAVSGRHITNSVVPWSWLGEQVLFVAPLGDSMDLWSVPLSARDWHVTAARRRLTTGVELVNHPSAAADGRIVFASLRSEVNVWSLAADANTGKVTGRLEQITYGAGQKIRPALSRDGSKLAFGVGASPEKTLGAIVLKDLRTARDARCYGFVSIPDSER